MGVVNNGKVLLSGVNSGDDNNDEFVDEGESVEAGDTFARTKESEDMAESGQQEYECDGVFDTSAEEVCARVEK